METSVKDFEFQQLCKIRLFKSPENIQLKRIELLASSSKYGLCFAGFAKDLLVFKTAEIFHLDEERRMTKRSQTIVENFPVLKNLTFSGQILNIAMSCDELTLLVVMEINSNVQLLFFDIRALGIAADCGPFLVSQIEAGNEIVDLAWNPTSPELLAICLSSGIVKMFNVSMEIKLMNSINIKATCLCWSPKGKQVVVGNQQGELKQFSPKLELKKSWPCPNNIESKVKVLDVVWVSTYMFIAAYETPQTDDELIVQIVNVPKDAEVNFINFSDPCYNFGAERQKKFFFRLLLKWDMVTMASSNSLETTILAKHLDEKNWSQWTLEDNSRAEVPLTEDKKDSFPLGVAIDYSSTQKIIFNEVGIGPFPLMMILSTDGVLVPFHMVYRHKEAVSLTNKAEELNPTGIHPSLPGYLSYGPLVVPGLPSSDCPPAAAPAPAAAITAAPTATPTPIATPSSIATTAEATAAVQGTFPSLEFETKVVTPTIKPQIPALSSASSKPTKRTESGGHVISPEVSSYVVDRKQQNAINEKVNSTLAKSMLEEINHFKEELKNLKERLKSCQAVVGVEEEKKELRKRTEDLVAFSHEIKNTTTVQQKELADEKLLLFDLFQMLEECRIKDERNHDVRYHKMLRAQCLDPASAEILNSLHQMQQMLTNGLCDANVVLDQQWEDFQNKLNKKGRKLKPSGTSTIYQVIKKNQNIINGQKLILKNIATQLKDMHLYEKDTWSYESLPTIKPGESELSSLADTLIASECKESSNVSSSKGVVISPLKQTKLREHLLKRSVNIVKVEGLGKEMSTLSIKNLSKFDDVEEKPTVKQFPAANLVRDETLQRPAPETTANFASGLKRGLLSNSLFSTPEIGTGFFLSGQATSLETSTPLKTTQKPLPVEGFFPPYGASNYASGLNLEDVTPTCSVSGEDEIGASTVERSYPEEGEDDDEGEDGGEIEEEEEEYPYSADTEGVEEVVQENLDSQDTVTPVITTSASTFSFPKANSSNLPFGNNTGFSFATSTTGSLFPNMASSHLSSVTPPTKTTLFSTPPSTLSSQNVLVQPSTETFKNQISTSAASTRLGLLATPTTSTSFGVSKNLFANTTTTTTTTTSSTPAFSFSTNTISKPVDPSIQTPPLSSETQPAVSLPISEKPGNILSPASPETAGPTSSPATSSPLAQTAITTTATTATFAATAIPITTKETSKPNVIFSFAPQTSHLEPTSQANTLPFATSLTLKATTSTPSTILESTAIPPSSLFQSPPVSSTTAAISPSPLPSPAAGLFTVPASTTAGLLFKPPPSPAITPPVTTVITTSSTSPTTLAAFSPLSNKPSIAAGTVASSPASSPTPDSATTTSTLGSLLSSPMPATKGESLLQSLTANSSNSGTPETTPAATVATTASSGLIFSPPSLTTASTLFGQSSPSTTSSTTSTTVAELFKPQIQSPVTTSTGLFGKPTSPPAGSELFGKMAATSNPAQGLFSQASAGGTNLFGQATVSASNSIISGTTSGTMTGTIFGAAKSVFGNAPSGALFGATPSSTATQPAATSANPFGQSSMSGFGQASNLTGFGKAAFGQPAFGQSSESFKTVSAFGQSGSSTSVFGQASSGTSVFGQPSSTPNGGVGGVGIFGNAGTSSSTTAAAAATASSTPSSSSNLFGSSSPFFSDLGGKPSQENVDKNVFGNTNQVFGQASPTANIFGGQSSNSGFKSVSLASPKLNNSFGFGSTAGSNTGTISTPSAGNTVATSGFGVTQQQQSQNPGGFGASSSFGTSPSFGGAPAFGSKSTFGFGTSTFGSNVPSFSSTFGGAQSSNVFGQASSSQSANSPGFANFAQSSSPTFGSLAQTSPGFGQQNNTGFGGGGGVTVGGGVTGGGVVGSGGGGAGSFGSVPSFGSNPGSFGSTFGQSASFTGYRS